MRPRAIIVWLTHLSYALGSLPSSTTSIKSAVGPKTLFGQQHKFREEKSGQQIPPAEDMNRCSRVDCSNHGSCLYCTFPPDCRTESLMVNCSTNGMCIAKKTVAKQATCRYCWQTAEIQHTCERTVGHCSIDDVNLITTVCRVNDGVICRGSRTFYKNLRCKWTSGHSWARALFLSITLGGFGFDRFYLGLWKSGIGKLFSFGGLGIWTIVDIVLIAIGYLQPADGSLYI